MSILDRIASAHTETAAAAALGVVALNRWASLLGPHHRLARVCGWRFSAEAWLRMISRSAEGKRSDDPERYR